MLHFVFIRLGVYTLVFLKIVRQSVKFIGYFVNVSSQFQKKIHQLNLILSISADNLKLP